MQESDVRAKLRDWILKHAKTPPGQDFSDQTQLLEQGILSSLDIVEFVLFIESLRGEDVDVEDIEPAVFTCIDSLYEAFFAAMA
jgi:acyl carrier protein